MDPLQRYSSSLKRAKSFFEGKNTKTPKGTPITQSQLLKLYQNRADCPICGTEFSGTNHNTEHIHPRALGGANVASNKIQMCKLCNNCRNMTMQHGLIGPPYSKSYPQMWEQIQRFIMWAEITIDDGLQAGEMFPEIISSSWTSALLVSRHPSIQRVPLVVLRPSTMLPCRITLTTAHLGQRHRSHQQRPQRLRPHPHLKRRGFGSELRRPCLIFSLATGGSNLYLTAKPGGGKNP